MTRRAAALTAAPAVLAAALLPGCQQAQETVEPALRAEVQARPTIRVWPAPEPGSAELLDKLERPVPEIVFESIPFEDVIEFLREKGEISIWVNWKALEAAGIERDAEVMMKLSDIRLGKVIDMLLYDVGGGDVPLAHAFCENVLIISTRDHLAREAFVRIYDVRPLLRNALEGSATEARKLFDEVVVTALQHGLLTEPDADEEAPEPSGEETVDRLPRSLDLLDLIRQTVEPAS